MSTDGDAGLRIQLLGPVRCWRGDQELKVGAARPRAVLGMLAARANQAVSRDELVDGLWGQEPPASAVNGVHIYIAGLRRVLEPHRAPRTPWRIIIGGGQGYSLLIDPGQVDALAFEEYLDRARRARAAGDLTIAVQSLDAALGLWQAVPFPGIRCPWAEFERTRLGQLRLTVIEERTDILLAQGLHSEVVAELAGLVREHPLREQFRAQLMLALYRCGRQAEALAAYAETRQILIEELGIEPGAPLRRLHTQILAGDAALNTAPPVPGPVAVAAPAKPVPRELPADIDAFTGRKEELTALDCLLPAAAATAPVILVVSGTAGVGKTALAVHWAHQVKNAFPDGQLHVNLRGFGPSGVPTTPAEAVRGFLDALGVPPERIPAQQDAQAGLYRSLLADKRMLIVLDNARDEGQVRPLLPASPASLVLVTSRSQLAGLAAADGARLVSLDLLADDEAVQLLSARIGADRAAAEPGAVGEIATLCAHLPLALAVAAARAAARPRFRLRELAAELRDTAGRLDALDAGDPAVSVAAVFSWSYRQLDPEAARMFRLLGLHPGPDISVPAAASLAAVDELGARRLLRELARDCLITEHVPGRYASHDLLRNYAATRARDCDSQPDRDAAIGRVLDHYLHTASHSSMLLQPSREQVALAPPRPGARPERPDDHRQAMAWFEAEHQVLLAAITLAADTAEDGHAWQLPWTMTEYLYRQGYLDERVTIMGSALAAATRLDDPLGQAVSLRRLGNARAQAGDYDQARGYLERCLPLYQRLDDRLGEAWAQQGLAGLAVFQGRYADALGHTEQALRLLQAIGDELGKADMLGNVGWCHANLGDYQQARTFCEQSLALSAKLGGSHLEYHVWDTLGYTELHLGNFAKALEHFEVALNLCRDDGQRYTEAVILSNVGDTRHATGELPRARQAWQQALAIYDEIGHPDAAKVRAKLARLRD